MKSLDTVLASKKNNNSKSFCTSSFLGSMKGLAGKTGNLIILMLGLLLFSTVSYSQYGWLPKPSPVNDDLVSVSFYNLNTGYACGGTTIIKTVNGGETWSVFDNVTATDTYRRIKFLNANTGVINFGTSLYLTTNGGTSWVPTSVPCNYLEFVDDLNGYASYPGYLYSTTNGGVTWINNDVPFVPSNTGNACLQGAFALSLGSLDDFMHGHRNMYVYRNGECVGGGWYPGDPCAFELLYGGPPTTPPPSFTLPYIVNNSAAILYAGTKIYRSLDGGSGWSQMSIGSSIAGFGLANANTWYAAGGGGMIYYSTNSGGTWFPQNTGSSSQINAVKMLGVYAGFAVGNGGVIFKTTTGGITFPVPPALLSPANNSTGISLTPFLDWVDNLQAVSYRVQIASDVSFNSIVLDSSTSAISEFTIPPGTLNPNTVYYWHVAALNYSGWGPFSDNWNFRTFNLPDRTNLSSPLNNSVEQPTTITFSWFKTTETSTGISVKQNLAGNYRSGSPVILSNDGTDNILKYWFELTADTVTMAGLIQDTEVADTTKVVSGLTPITKYYWRVRAANVIGWGNFSSWWNFTTIAGPPQVPVLISPADLSIQPPVNLNFTWNKAVEITLSRSNSPANIDAVSKYWFELTTDTSTFAGIVRDSSLVDTIKTMSLPGTSHTYYWRVRAKNQLGWGLYSSWWKFITVPDIYGWHLQASGVGGSNTSMSFVNSRTGWISASNAIYKTTDGGDNWFVVHNIMEPMFPKDISFSNETQGTIASGSYYGGEVYPEWHSYDGGISWNPVAYTNFLGADFKSTSAGWFSGTLTVFAQYGNPPATYSSINSSVLYHNIPLNRTKAGADNVWTVGNSGIIYRGLSQVSGVNDSANLNALSFPAANTGYVTGGTFIFKTTDNGGTWVRLIPLNLQTTYGDIYFSNANTGCITGSLSGEAIILGTTDGGVNWALQYKGPYGGNHLCFGNSSTGWLLCGSSVLKTSSGGNIPVFSEPSLLAPANNTTAVTLTPSLDWNDVHNAVIYRVQLSADPAFSTSIIDDSSSFESNFAIPSGLLNYFTVYYWRVAAKDNTSWSAFSGTWQFRTFGVPQNVVLSNPPNNAVNQHANTTFSWFKTMPTLNKNGYIGNELFSKASGSGEKNVNSAASSYWFEMTTDTNTLAGLVSDTTLTDTLKAVSGLVYATNYYWRVRANNEVGWGAFSYWWKFTTVDGLPVKVTLSSPANNSVDQHSTLTFRWFKAADNTLSKSTSANSRKSTITESIVDQSQLTSYLFELTSDTITMAGLYSDSVLVDTSKTVGGLNFRASYYWRVKAKNSRGFGAYSDWWKFTVIDGLPEYVTLYAPENNATDLATNQAFIWYTPAERTLLKPNGNLTAGGSSGSDAVNTYWFELAKDTVSMTGLVRDSSLSDTTKIINDLERSTKYFWRVKANNSQGWGTFSNWWQFTTTDGLPRQITLFSPDNGLTDLPPGITFTWYTPTEPMPGLNSAKDKNAPFLDGKASGSPVNVASNKGIDAIDYYWFEMVNDPNTMEGLIVDSTITDTTKYIGGISLGITHFWRVRAHNQFGWGPYSDWWSFTTSDGLPGQIQLYSPDNGAPIWLDTTFNWYRTTEPFSKSASIKLKSKSKTNFNPDISKSIRKYPQQNDAVDYYWFEIVTNPETMEGLMIDSALTDTTKYVSGLAAGMNYYWRVKAHNIYGWGPFSEWWNCVTTLKLPPVPELTSPEYGQGDVTMPTVIQWNDYNSDSLFRVQIATEWEFTNIVVDDSSLTSTQLTIPAGVFSQYTTYCWRVAAKNQYGWSNFADAWYFSTGSGLPAAPELVSPIDGEAGVSTTAMLKWIDYSADTLFYVQVAADPDFTELYIDNNSVSGSQYQIPTGVLNPVAAYYWRVAAYNLYGQGEFSPTWSFTTLGLPYTVELNSPPNNAGGVSPSPVFNWFVPSEAAAKMHAAITKSPNKTGLKQGTSPNRKLAAGSIERYLFELTADTVSMLGMYSDSLLTDTTTSRSNMGYLKSYYWRVKAKNITGWGEYSAWWKFTTADSAALAAPVLLSPSNNSYDVSTMALLDWSDIAGAGKYRVQVSVNSSFTSIALDDSSASVSQLQIPSGHLAYNSGYYWRVAAGNYLGWGPFQASPFRFFTMIIPPPQPPVPVSPPNGSAGGSTATLLDWEDVSGAVKYRAQVSSDPAFGALIINDTGITSSTFAIPAGVLSGSTTYYWKIQAKNSMYWGDPSETWNFVTPPAPVAVVRNNPTDGSIDQPLNMLFNWFAASEALSKLKMRPKTEVSPVFNVKNNKDAITAYWFELVTDTVTLAGLVQDTTIADTTKFIGGLNTSTAYYWRVRAFNGVEWGPFGNWWKFTTTNGLPQPPMLISPADGAVRISLTPNLVWLDLGVGAVYHVQLSGDSLFASMLHDDSTLIASQYSVPNGMLSPLTNYFWRVAVKNEFGWSNFAATRKFRTVGLPLNVLLSAPANDSLNLGSTVDFSWFHAAEMMLKQNSVLQTDKFDTKKSTAKQNVNTVSSYWFELVTDTIAMSGLQADSLLTDTTKQLNGLAFATAYYWRVKAKNEIGWGTFSSWWRFATVSGLPSSPVLIAPSHNSTNNLITPLFDWSDVAGAVKYRVQVSAFSSFSTLWYDDSSSTSSQLQMPSGYLAYNSAYYWRVKAKNAAGWGNYQVSPFRFFTLVSPPPSAPTLVSPANGAIGVSLTPVLDWNDVSGAAKYRVQLSADSTFSTILINDSSSVVSSFTVAPGVLAANTLYYWRVAAKNTVSWGSNSAVWNFTTVSAALPPVVLYSPDNNSTEHPLNILFQWYVPVEPAGLLSISTKKNAGRSPVFNARDKISSIDSYTFELVTDTVSMAGLYSDSTIIDSTRFIGGLAPSTSYYWHVKAKFSGVWGPYSSWWRFSTTSGLPQPPVLISPADGAIGLTLTPSLVWLDVGVGSLYHVQLSADSLFGSFLVNDSTIMASQYNVPAGMLMPLTDYYWRAAVKNEIGWSSFTAKRKFRTIGLPMPVVLNSPANGAAGVDVNTMLSWFTAVEPMNKLSHGITDSRKNSGGKLGIDAISSYWLELTTDTVTLAGIFKDSTITDTTYQLSSLSNNTSYYWRVKAHNQAGWGGFSGWWKFTTSAVLSPVVLFAPDNNSTEQPLNILFQWFIPVESLNKLNMRKIAGTGRDFGRDNISSIDGYTFELVTDTVSMAGLLSDSSIVDSTKFVGGLAPSTTYFWHVKAKFSSTWGPCSSWWRFSTTSGLPQPPVLISPADGAIGLTLTPSLVWLDLGVGAVYHVQLSADSLFGSFIVDDSTIMASQYNVSAGMLAPQTDYFWRVAVKNEFGWSVYAAKRKFRTIGIPMPVVLSSPANGATGIDTSVTFSWLAAIEPMKKSLQTVISDKKKSGVKLGVDAISSYWFELTADTVSLAGIRRDSTVTDTTYTIGLLSFSTSYYWRVKAHNQAGWGAFSGWWKFTTLGNLPAAPVLISPLNNSYEIPVTPMCDWSDVAGALKYRIQISAFSSFATLWYDDSTSTISQLQVPSGYLAYNSVYYWRVKAKNASGWGNYQSSPFRFFTMVVPPPAVPVLVSPANGSTGASLTPTLDWNDVSGAAKYKIQLATDSSFASPVVFDSTLVSSIYNVTAGVLSGNTVYYWRVAAKNAATWGSYSAIWNFKTLGLPYPVVLSSPANNATEQPLAFNFSWLKPAEMMLKSVLQKSAEVNSGKISADNIYSVSGYWFEMVTDTVSMAGLLRDSLLTDTTKAISGLVSSTAYYWRVKAQNSIGWGEFSGWWSFTTTTGLPPAVPVQISPPHNSFEIPTTPLLDWSDVAGATNYRVQISAFSNFSTLWLDDSTVTSSQKQVAPGILAYNASYYWRVKAKNSAGWGSYQSNPFRFFTMTVPPPSAPVLVSPANNSTGNSLTPLLDWNDLSGVTKYRVQVSLSSGFGTLLVDDSSLVTSQYNVAPGVLAAGTVYYWRVAAKGNTAWGSFSSAWNFKTLGTPNAVTLITPANNSTEVTASPVFGWLHATETLDMHGTSKISGSEKLGTRDNSANSLKGADNIDAISAYWFELVTDTVSMSGLLRDTLLADTAKSVSGLIINTVYYWRVRAQNSIGWGAFSLWWKFTTVSGLPPAAPVLISPSNNAFEIPVTPVMDWSDVAGALKYRIQVSAFSNFATLWYDDSSATISQIQVPSGYLAYNSVYYWRVKARNSTGWGSYQASPFRFYTMVVPPPTTPVLVSPANGAVGIALNPVLDWNDVSGATKYRVQVSFSPVFSSFVVDDSTITPSQYGITVKMFNDTVYYWRVAAKNNTTWSSFSAAWSFRTAALLGPPTLLYPGSGDTGVVNNPLMDWSDVQGAAKYRLQISAFSNFSVLWVDAYPTASTYQVPPGILAYNSRYFWRVKSLNAGDSSAFSSARYFFTRLFPYTANDIQLNQLQSVTLDLTWLKAEKNQLMTIEISKDTSFKETVMRIDTANTGSVDLAANLFEDNSTYFWRVKLADSRSKAIYSITKVFVTGVSSPMMNSIRHTEYALPTEFALQQNYPNPFNPTTKIRFAIPVGKSGSAGVYTRLTVYDALGKEVAVLVNSDLLPGIYNAEWNAAGFGSGIYFYRLEAGKFVETRKMILMK